MFVWPCSLCLALFVFSQRRLFGRPGLAVLELGAGTALPGLLAARLNIGGWVALTDRDCGSVQRNMRQSIALNALEDRANAGALEWGSLRLPACAPGTPDIVLGADLFYHEPQFGALMATVASIFLRNPRAVFFLAHHERCADACIAPLLLEWGLAAEHIPTSSFATSRELRRLAAEAGAASGDAGLPWVTSVSIVKIVSARSPARSESDAPLPVADVTLLHD
eukprot:g7148.t1